MMNNADMRGIFSALLVSYNEDGSINEKGLREIIRHNIDNMKVDGLYVGGSTGENFMISTEEKKRIFKMAPIHHHFEQCGWPETRVVFVFWIVTVVLCWIGVLAVF